MLFKQKTKNLMLLPKCNLKRSGAISCHGKPQFDQMFLPISGASPSMGLLGLRMNWHWVSGGRHWSSSRTPGQSVGLVRSRPGPPPRPAALLPPSRMWLILMLKGNSWPEWEESQWSDLCRTGTFYIESLLKTCRRGENLIEIRGKFVFGSDESWGGTFGGF